MILCLFRMGVLDRGLKVKVLGVFCLSVSHQVIGKVIKEIVENADLWRGGGADSQQGSWPGATPSVTPLC